MRCGSDWRALVDIVPNALLTTGVQLVLESGKSVKTSPRPLLEPFILLAQLLHVFTPRIAFGVLAKRTVSHLQWTVG